MVFTREGEKNRCGMLVWEGGMGTKCQPAGFWSCGMALKGPKADGKKVTGPKKMENDTPPNAKQRYDQ